MFAPSPSDISITALSWRLSLDLERWWTPTTMFKVSGKHANDARTINSIKRSNLVYILYIFLTHLNPWAISYCRDFTLFTVIFKSFLKSATKCKFLKLSSNIEVKDSLSILSIIPEWQLKERESASSRWQGALLDVNKWRNNNKKKVLLLSWLAFCLCT